MLVQFLTALTCACMKIDADLLGPRKPADLSCPCDQVVEKADVIFIAVKPQYVGVVLKEVRGSLRENHTIVSIAAGVTLAQLKVTDCNALCFVKCAHRHYSRMPTRPSLSHFMQVAQCKHMFSMQ